MARLSQRLSNVNVNTDLHASTAVLDAGPPLSPLSIGRSPGSLHHAHTRNSHHTLESDHSSTTGDLLLDEQEEEPNTPRKKNTQIAFHLASWFAYRTGSNLDVIYPEVAGIISACSVPENHPLQANDLDKSTKTLSTGFKPATIKAGDDDLSSKSEKKHKSDKHFNVHKVETKHENQHPRFSFIPGDDIQGSRLERARSTSSSAVRSESRTGRYNTAVPLDAKDHIRARELLTLEAAQSTIAGPANEGSSQPRRGDSNRSVLTAINNGSYSSSNGPLKASSSNSGTARRSDRCSSTAKKDSFATAAARKAGKNIAKTK